VARPREEQSAATDLVAAHHLPVARTVVAPRAANDNFGRFSRHLWRLVPLLIAAALLSWAMWQVIAGH